MDAKARFASLEIACREQARAAQNELKYWLNEADEWARLKEKAVNSAIEGAPLQFEMLRDCR